MAKILLRANETFTVIFYENKFLKAGKVQLNTLFKLVQGTMHW